MGNYVWTMLCCQLASSQQRLVWPSTPKCTTLGFMFWGHAVVRTQNLDPYNTFLEPSSMGDVSYETRTQWKKSCPFHVLSIHGGVFVGVGFGSIWLLHITLSFPNASNSFWTFGSLDIICVTLKNDVWLPLGLSKIWISAHNYVEGLIA